VCITSDLALTTVPPPEGVFALADVQDVAVLFRPAQGAKCERCWRVLPDVGTHKHPGTCARCSDALG
jgi:isoleucyl-tRNA synthetase